MGDWVYLVSWLLLLTLFGAMVYLAWWALFHDRSNGKRRCPRCWYDLSYSPAPVPGLRCSECGFTPLRERQLGRTRRRWAHFALAVLVCLTIAAFVQFHTAKRGWSATMPTGVLLVALPYVDHSSSWFHELLDRAETGLLTDAQWVALMERCAAGDITASPTDRAWRQKYGLIITTVRRSLARDPETGLMIVDPDRPYRDAELPLIEIPPRIEVHAPRDTWPENETAWAAVSMAEWWPAESEVRLLVTPEGSEQPSSVIHFGPRADRPAGVGFPLPAPLAGEATVTISIEAQHRRGEREPWRSAGQQLHRFTLTTAAADDSLVEPVRDDDDEALMLLVRDMFRGEIVRWEFGPSPVRFRYTVQGAANPRLESAAVGAVLELRRGEELARQLEFWWLVGEDRSGEFGGLMQRGGWVLRPRDIQWRIAHENLDLLNDLDPEDDRWHMRVRGDRSIALRVPGARRYWAGELRMPITVSEQSGEAPPREVWVE